MEPSEQPQKIVSYRDLKVWQKGMDLVELTYDLACKLPPSEKYGLAAQNVPRSGFDSIEHRRGLGMKAPR